jgi:hypothetical protein
VPNDLTKMSNLYKHLVQELGVNTVVDGKKIKTPKEGKKKMNLSCGGVGSLFAKFWLVCWLPEGSGKVVRLGNPEGSGQVVCGCEAFAFLSVLF